MNKKLLSVRLYGKPVGILEQISSGKMQFNYMDSADQAISVRMPLDKKHYQAEQCEAFFGGLLPENETTRKLIGQRFNINPNNSFALLRVLGHDCAGAISFHEIDEQISAQNSFLLEASIPSEAELYQHIKELPKKPLFLDFEHLKLSLAGVHDKAPVCLLENKIALSQHGCPTTHILKPAVPGYEGIIENEYFCLRLAKAIGLPVPSLEIRQIKDISFLLIERYDRIVRDNRVARIHQEDFCQALGIASIYKYQNEGGPSFKNCFDFLKNTAQPIMDRNQLMLGLIFNFLIANMDAHAKNFSLLHLSSSSVTMAPFYDLLCTRVYESLSKKMAMKIGGEYDSEGVFTRHWERFCEEINYSFPALKKILVQQAEHILKAAENVQAELIEMKRDTKIIKKIIKIIQRRIELVDF